MSVFAVVDVVVFKANSLIVSSVEAHANVRCGGLLLKCSFPRCSDWWRTPRPGQSEDEHSSAARESLDQQEDAASLHRRSF